MLALLAAWFMPMCVLGFAIPFFPAPERIGQYMGYGIMILGLVLTRAPLRRFSSRMVVGMDQDELVTAGRRFRAVVPRYLLR